MILINSGAYVIAEFQAELGKIPPCMLPIGNRKLIETQVKELRAQYDDEPIFVTLPETYQLTLNEKRLLSDLNVKPIATSDDFSLAESILFALNTTDKGTSDVVRLIHGDTLIQDLPHSSQINVLGVAYARDDYGWKVEHTDGDKSLIWCGFFCFSSRKDLIQTLALSRGHFVKAVEDYRKRRSLQMIHMENWHDLGHINTYFKSRAKITTQRAFNTLQVSQGVVCKTGLPDIKIHAEANWFDQIPVKLKRFTPQLIDKGVSTSGLSYYQLEYLPLMPLNELFVHGRNSANEWRRMFELLNDFLKSCTTDQLSTSITHAIRVDFDELVQHKTLIRLQEYSQTSGFDLKHPTMYGVTSLPSVQHIAEHCIAKVKALHPLPAVMHGDLCFSNILFDSRAGQIKVIDPRGLTISEELMIFGDQKYDLAKLAHSVIGLYDFIIAGRYRLTDISAYHMSLDFELDDRICEIQNIFMNHQFGQNIRIDKILPLVILLFLSMLPLHADRPDRQRAMLANALRLYAQCVV